MSDPELVWDTGCLLGEGPLWFADEQRLRFVDIKQGMLHSFDPATGTGQSICVGGQPSFVMPHADGGMVIGSNHHLWHSAGAQLTDGIAQIDQPAHNRTNDGAVDAHGRLWLGTMDDREQEPTGTLYCWDRGVLHPTNVKAVVTNGPTITADGRTLYHVDSGQRTIWRYTIGDGPTLTDGEIFLQLTEADGYPDGVVLDAEGCLWVALWDGWAVRRYAPDGQLLQSILMPCARVTKIAFGGADLCTVYVTTARIGLGEEALLHQPNAGGLFAFRSVVPGVAAVPVRG